MNYHINEPRLSGQDWFNSDTVRFRRAARNRLLVAVIAIAAVVAIASKVL